MRKYFILNIIIAIALFLVFFSGMTQNEFLLLHDFYIELSAYDNHSGLFAISPTDLGTSNTFSLLSHLWDKLIYNLLFNIDKKVSWIQRLLVFIILNYSLALPLFGFIKISRTFNIRIAPFTLYAISLFFTFNTYTLIFWNTGILFSVTESLAFYMVPIAFITYHRAIFGESYFAEKIKSCLLLFLMSFALFIFATFVFITAIYSIIYILLNFNNFKKYISNLIGHAALYFPLALVLLVIPYDLLMSPSTSVNADQIASGGMYTALHGGLLYQILMWFWWPIYTYWEPRNILTFHLHFKESLSIIAPFLLYGTLIYYFIKNRDKNLQVLTVFLLLLVVFIFVKGPQEPFGGAYLFLLKYMPLSSVFRTPDNKFALGVIFCICLLFTFLSNENNRHVIALMILVVVTIQCYPLFTGLAIQGENTKVSRDRIVSISGEYSEVSNYINTNDKPYGYILSLPSVAFGMYEHDHTGAEGHIGQDMLSKLSSLPFIYVTETGGMSKTAYNDLHRIITSGDFTDLNKYPIKYILLRKDIICNSCLHIDAQSIKQPFIKVFENKLFTMYHNPLSQPMVAYSNTDIDYKIISPMKYKITLKNIKEDSIMSFAGRYSDSWELSPLVYSAYSDDSITAGFGINTILTFEDLSFFWKKAAFGESHSLYRGYANSWKLTRSYIRENIQKKYYKVNPDGSIDIKLTLYNKTQTLFYNTALISFAYALILFLIIIIGQRCPVKDLHVGCNTSPIALP